MFDNFSVIGSSLELLKEGEQGIIQFCNSQDEKILMQVLSLGLTPGTSITLVERLSNLVIKVGHQNLVVTKETARSIYVRVMNR